MMGFESGQIEKAIQDISKNENDQEYRELINLVGRMLENELKKRFTIRELRNKLEKINTKHSPD